MYAPQNKIRLIRIYAITGTALITKASNGRDPSVYFDNNHIISSMITLDVVDIAVAAAGFRYDVRMIPISWTINRNAKKVTTMNIVLISITFISDG